MLDILDYSEANTSDCHIICILTVKWSNTIPCLVLAVFAVLFLSCFFPPFFFFQKQVYTIVLCFSNFIFHCFQPWKVGRECFALILHSTSTSAWDYKRCKEEHFHLVFLWYRYNAHHGPCGLLVPAIHWYIRVVYATLRLRIISLCKKAC